MIFSNDVSTIRTSFDFISLKLCIITILEAINVKLKKRRESLFRFQTVSNVCRHGFVSKWFICYPPTTNIHTPRTECTHYLIDSAACSPKWINQIIHRSDWLYLSRLQELAYIFYRYNWYIVISIWSFYWIPNCHNYDLSQDFSFPISHFQAHQPKSKPKTKSI